MADRLSDKELALIAAARREVKAQAAGTPPVAAVVASTESRPEQGRQITRPVSGIAAPAETPQPVSRDSIESRIALLMAAEQQEKARRTRSMQRWKTGAAVAFVALVGWWASLLIGHLRH